MTLEALHDRSAIEDTVVALFVATDENDWKTVESCFAESVLFDMTSLAGGAPARLNPREITAGWSQGLAVLEAVHHQVGNLRVELAGGEARAFCYATASHFRRVASGRNTRTFVGSYELHLVRSAGRWRIDLFRFNLKFIEGNLELHAEPPAG